MAKYTHFCKELCLQPFYLGFILAFSQYILKLVAISNEMIP